MGGVFAFFIVWVASAIASVPIIAVLTILRASRRRRFRRELQIVLAVAAAEVKRRQHAALTVDHVAWALLAAPDLKRAMQDRGVAVRELREAFERRLEDCERAPLGPTTPKPKARAELERVVRSALLASTAMWGALGTVESLLRALLATPSTFARETLTKRGIDETWATTFRTADAKVGGVGRGGALQPYRGGAARATTKVILWNDSRSTMDGVISVLQETFDMSEAEAMYTTLLVHEAGRTTACWCDDEEAARLAARATRAARDRGMPLRVTIEPIQGKRGMRRRDEAMP